MDGGGGDGVVWVLCSLANFLLPAKSECFPRALFSFRLGANTTKLFCASFSAFVMTRYFAAAAAGDLPSDLYALVLMLEKILCGEKEEGEREKKVVETNSCFLSSQEFLINIFCGCCLRRIRYLIGYLLALLISA